MVTRDHVERPIGCGWIIGPKDVERPRVAAGSGEQRPRLVLGEGRFLCGVVAGLPAGAGKRHHVAFIVDAVGPLDGLTHLAGRARWSLRAGVAVGAALALRPGFAAFALGASLALQSR
jgi:hypothetical protein